MICLFARDASCKAANRPRVETRMAVNLYMAGRVIIGTFRGIILEVIRVPAIMLPKANRLSGLISIGLFSLIGQRVLNRG